MATSRTDERIRIDDQRPVYFKVSVDDAEVYFWGYATRDPAPFQVEAVLEHTKDVPTLLAFLGLNKRQGFENAWTDEQYCVCCVEDPDNHPDNTDGLSSIREHRVFECASCEKAFVAV